MTKPSAQKFYTVTVILALIAAMALSFAGCAKDEVRSPGIITVTIEIVDDTGASTEHVIETEAATLWDVLSEAGLAEGDDGPYGVMIHTVGGLRADYTLDGAYWALYQDGEYLTSGAETTLLSDGGHYELVYTKA